jgi:glutamine amidotransferase
MKDVVVIDYGMGNLKSVRSAFEAVGGKVSFSSEPSVVSSANRLVLPGVGAFKDGMQSLNNLNLIPAIEEFVNTKRPLLGICLGMQMFFEVSEEYGQHKGLSLVKGQIKSIPKIEKKQLVRKVPHIGWSRIHESYSWNGTCLSKTSCKEYFYFVHSYMAMPNFDEEKLAVCNYNGIEVAAAVKKENIIGLQFHPEKSGRSGLNILKQFMSQ